MEGGEVGLMEAFFSILMAITVGWRKTLAAGAGNVRSWAAPALTWLQRHRKPVAVVVSVALHLLALLFLLPQAQVPDGFAGGAGGTDDGAGQGISVDLSALNDASKDALTVKALTSQDTADLTPADQVQLAETTPQPQLSDLSDAVVQTPPQPQPQAAEASAQEAAAAAGGPGQDGTAAGDGDALWNAIAPCWRKMASADAVPVQLSVSFADDGNLAVPPDIVPDPNHPADMTAMRSETQAIQALAACGAYAMAGGRQNVQIHFPKPN